MKKSSFSIRKRHTYVNRSFPILIEKFGFPVAIDENGVHEGTSGRVAPGGPPIPRPPPALLLDSSSNSLLFNNNMIILFYSLLHILYTPLKWFIQCSHPTAWRLLMKRRKWVLWWFEAHVALSCPDNSPWARRTRLVLRLSPQWFPSVEFEKCSTLEQTHGHRTEVSWVVRINVVVTL